MCTNGGVESDFDPNTGEETLDVEELYAGLVGNFAGLGRGGVVACEDGEDGWRGTLRGLERDVEF